MRKKRAAPKNKASLSGETIKVDPVEKAPETVNSDPKPDIKPSEPSSTPPKVKSPLLSDSVEVKEHAMGVGPGSGQAQQNPNPNPQSQAGGGFKVDNAFFKRPQDNPALALMDEPKKEPVNISTPPPVNDAPEQVFNMSPTPPPSTAPGLQDPNVIPIPDDIARQGAADLTDTIMDMYKRLVPDGTHEFTKIPESDIREIKKAETEGAIIAGMAEELASTNKENKQKLKDRAKEDAAMIKKPLQRMLEAKQVQAPPHIELIIVLIFVVLTYGFMIREIKSSNKNLIEKLYQKIAEKKGEVKSESDVPLVHAEEVK